MQYARVLRSTSRWEPRRTSALRAVDLRTLQVLNKSEAEGSPAANKLVRLYVYNLKSLQAGAECLPESGLTWPNTGENCAGTKARGNPGPYMWSNGWAGGWLQHLVMDDLEYVLPGTFCNAKFHTLSREYAVSGVRQSEEDLFRRHSADSTEQQRVRGDQPFADWLLRERRSCVGDLVFNGYATAALVKE